MTTTADTSGVGTGRPEVLPDPAPWDRHADRRVVAVLFLCVLAVYLATATYSYIQMNDTRATAVAAWNLGTRGTLALPDEWTREDLEWVEEGTDGHMYAARFPAPIVWTAPFYAVAGVFDDGGIPPHPWLISFVPAAIAAAAAAALAVTLSFVLFRRLADRRTAVGAALVLAFGTSVWSISADAVWTHGLTHLFMVLGLLYLTDDREARGGLALAGAVIARPQTAIVAATLGVARAWERRSLRSLVVVGVTSGLGIAAMSVYSWVLFGTWLPTAGYSSSKVGNVASTSALETLARVWGTLFDVRRGGLVYTPVLVLTLAGAFIVWRRVPSWVKASALAGVLYLGVQLRANGFDGGHNYFGPRLFTETLILLSPLALVGYLLWVRRSSVRRVALAVIVAMSVLLHGLGATILTYPQGTSEVVSQRLADRCEELGVSPQDC